MTHARGIVVAILVAGCGNDGTEALQLSIPWQAGLSCPQRTQMGAKMAAVLKIGGHNDCNLAVDAATLEVSGNCDTITTGTVRPLLLTYTYDDQPTLPSIIPLAYWISYVNLCDDHLSPDSREIEVVFGSASSKLVTTPSELAALPADTTTRPSCTDGLNEALQWAKTQIEEMGGNLDKDLDNNSNLAEVCTGTPP